jgi:DNA polymerase-3 subunit gamma/tau
MSPVLYREWRPQTWDEVVGQEHVVQTLRNAVRGDRLAHAYLFAGPRGTGKTTTARLLAKAANCLAEDRASRPCNQCGPCLAVNAGRFLDLIEIDAASNTSVDDVRELRDRINFAPNEGRYKIYIVDEVHMLSTAAFNALLKTLEEPPAHAFFILATTEVHKIPATVLSRCQRHEFRRLPVAVITKYLQDQGGRQGYQLDPEALDLIARQSTGSLRDAISLLDQLVSAGEVVTLSFARQVLGTTAAEVVWELLDTLPGSRIGEGLTVLNRALDRGSDPRQLARQVVGALRTILLIQLGEAPLESVSQAELPKLRALAEGIRLGQLLTALRAFGQATHTQPGNWQPGLALELAYLESARPPQPAKDSEPAARGRLESPAEREPDRPAEPPKSAPGQTASTGVGRPRVERGPSGGQAESRRPIREPRPPAAPLRSKPDHDLPEIEFRSVLELWPQLLAAAYRRDPKAQALLNSGKPMGLSGAGLVLGFQSDLLREKMEKGPNAQVIAESLAEVFGRPVGVRCVLIEDWKDPSTAAPPPVQEGGMVAMALRDLGGQVVDYEQLPPPVEGDAEAA